MHSKIIAKLEDFYQKNRTELSDAGVAGYILDAISDAKYEQDLYVESTAVPFDPQAEWGTLSKFIQGVK